MNNLLKKYWLKITDKTKLEETKILERIEKEKKIFQDKFEHQINNFYKKIQSNQPLNLLHSGHAADVVNVLPVIKELSKNHECNLYIQINKPLKYYHKHPAGNVFINTKIYNMLRPLLSSQKYINKVEKFNNQSIDIDFDIYREMPINLLFDNTKYSFLITGLQPSLLEPYIEVDSHEICLSDPIFSDNDGDQINIELGTCKPLPCIDIDNENNNKDQKSLEQSVLEKINE